MLLFSHEWDCFGNEFPRNDKRAVGDCFGNKFPRNDKRAVWDCVGNEFPRNDNVHTRHCERSEAIPCMRKGKRLYKFHARDCRGHKCPRNDGELNDGEWQT